MAARKVIAPLITARFTDGKIVYYHRGDVLPDEGISDESLDHLFSLGFITGSDDDSYESKTKAELRALIDVRNENRDEAARLPVTGSKADLAQVLAEDDADQAQ